MKAWLVCVALGPKYYAVSTRGARGGRRVDSQLMTIYDGLPCLISWLVFLYVYFASLTLFQYDLEYTSLQPHHLLERPLSLMPAIAHSPVMPKLQTE